MKGYSDDELGAIDVELKEAVCDALVGTLVARVSGTDARGATILGRSPRRGVMAGQLLPRFDATGEDDTSDIRIAAIGIDVVLRNGQQGKVSLTPRFSAYMRVIPVWEDLIAGGGELDFEFKLQATIQQEIDAQIRAERQPALQLVGLDRPDWRAMDEAKRSKVRAQRAEILAEVRQKAYAAHGIQLLPGDPDETPFSPALEGEVIDDPNVPDEAMPPPPPLSRLIRDGRSIPLGLVDPAPIPGKWRRLDLKLPTLEFKTGDSDDALALKLRAYNTELAASIKHQFDAWLAEGGAAEVWRDVRITPADTLSETAWTTATTALASQPVDRDRVIPDLSGVQVKIDRQRDFLDPDRVSVRVMLDNQSSELSPLEAAGRCNTVFGTSITVTLPAFCHLPLKLDRVEPSYRFRDYLEYPAIGLNCGVEAEWIDDDLALTTTSAPRFAQPRIVARRIDLPFEFALLADPAFDASRLLELPRSYSQWIDEQEQRLKTAVIEGLGLEDAAIETKRLRTDLAAQRAEAAYIKRGVELLIESQKAAEAIRNAEPDAELKSLERLAEPPRDCRRPFGLS
ncbi:hypothetical protein [Parasphingorhabdus sp.]|uniref:hypothetical protein n=1 Tax=Parasphingorhabdus sp. TaxID=2709688 RepID=UPI00359476A3